MKEYMIESNPFIDSNKVELFLNENKLLIVQCYKNNFTIKQTWEFILK